MRIHDEVWLCRPTTFGLKSKKFKVMKIDQDKCIIKRKICPIRTETLEVPKNLVSMSSNEAQSKLTLINKYSGSIKKI